MQLRRKTSGQEVSQIDTLCTVPLVTSLGTARAVSPGFSRPHTAINLADPIPCLPTACTTVYAVAPSPGPPPVAGAVASESGRVRARSAAGTKALAECPNRSRTDYVPSSTVRVCYRYHPLFNREAQVVRRCPNVPPDGILIVLPDGSRCVLPSWMLDPVVCSSFTDDSEPRIALSALWALRQLIDKSLPLSKPSVTSGAPANTGGDHAQAKDSATAFAVLH